MTLAHAARLLAAARSLGALAPIARAAGVTGPITPLSRAARDTLAPGLAAQAHVITGPAPLHALLADLAGPPLRDSATRLATHLSAVSPHHHWLLLLRHTHDGTCALAAWHSTARSTPRLAALRFHPDALTPSDADTVRALAARASAAPTPLLTHTAWLDVLGRDALGTRFYRTLDHVVTALADSLPPSVAEPTARADLALLCTSRLLFLAFLEAKGWLDHDRAFLTRHYDAAMRAGGRFHARTLRPLFFGTLNTPRRHRAPAARALGKVPFLNGGLFAPTPLERRHRTAQFSDESLGALVHTLLARHRFTAHEDTASWSEAAVDPEMLGRAFESLMHARDRHTTGAFYTPRPLVEHATTEALRHALHTADGESLPPRAVVDAALAGTTPAVPLARQLHARIETLRLLDPACGSGAFLVHALERLAALLAICGDPRPLADRRQAVLTRSIFGVDVNPTAVWLCELRLWLSVVVERDVADPYDVPPLPNLDHNVRVGDALAVPPGLEPLTRHSWGGAPWGAPTATGAPATRAPHLAILRARYATLAGPRKLSAARRLEAAERACALAALDGALAGVRHARADALAAARTPDLFGERHRPTATARANLTALRAAARTLAARRRALAAGSALPFGFAWHFADAAANEGFDLLLGNPPWVRPHALPPATRVAFRTHYASARDATPTPGFGHQIDLAALFTERALALTRPGGVAAFLLPAKLWRTLSGAAIRTLVLRESHPLTLEDWSDAPSTFDAAVYPSLLVARRVIARRRHAPTPPGTTGAGHADQHPAAPPSPPVAVRVHHARTHTVTHLSATQLPLDTTSGAPWLLLPGDVRDAFDALGAAGPALAHTRLPRPTLGVKCGCNDAFLVHVHEFRGDLAYVRHGDREGTVERALLRPTVRGEHLARITPPLADDAPREHLVWPYDATGRLLGTLPPHAARWLTPWRSQLAHRSDARGSAAATTAWWTLFRTDGATPHHARVVWPDLARTPHPHVLRTGDPRVPLNSCYVAVFDDLDDARAFAALLAAPPVAAWLATLAEPARGGYRRFLAWTVARLPIPQNWAAARTLLAPLGPHAPPEVLTRAVTAAYAIDGPALAPLLAWARTIVGTEPAGTQLTGTELPSTEFTSNADAEAAEAHESAGPWLYHAAPAPRRVREPAWATRAAPRPDSG